MSFVPNPASANQVIFTEGFSAADRIDGAFRLFHRDADTEWQADFTTNSGNPSDWEVSGGQLINPGIEAGKPSEGAVSYLHTVSLTDNSLDEIGFSFDYTVGAGTTLYFHAIGLIANDPALPGSTQILNTQAQNGGIQDPREPNYVDISLFDGIDPNGSQANALAFSQSTSGTFSGAFDLSSFSSSGTTGITSISDLDYVAIAFATNMTNSDGTGAVSIDNFTITAAVAVPEPSSSLAFCVGLLWFGTRRRRRE